MTATTAVPIEQARGPFAPLRVRDFRLLFLIQFVTGLRQPMQFFAQAWYVNTAAPESQRVLLLGLLASLQGAAYLAYILFGGTLADRYPRKVVLLFTHGFGFAALLLIGTLLLLPGAADGEGLWLWVMLIVFMEFSLVLAQDFPARMALVAEVVPPHLRTGAVTLHWMVFSMAFLVAAPTVGLMLDTVGFAATYYVASLGHVVAIAALWLLRHEGEPADPDAAGQSMLDNVRAGIGYLREAPGVRWVVLIAWASMAAGMTAMGLLIAAWVDEVLGLSAAGWGIMALFWGIGGVLASGALASAGDYRGKGRIYIGAVAFFGLAVLVFSLSRNVVFSGAMFLMAGASFQMVITLANTIVQDTVPNRLLGRVMGLLFMAQGIAQANGIIMGGLAQLVGLEVFYPALGTFMISAGLLAASRRSLRDIA